MLTARTNIDSKKWTTLSMSERVFIAVLAICVTMAALFLAVLIGGPLARAFFGVPVGFREHFTSSAAFRQALLVQAVTVGFAFLLLGVALGREVESAHFCWTVWAA